MANVAPNLAALIGDTVGARLISHAGSLTNLAKYPASTVQILGAEKALFRALKTKGLFLFIISITSPNFKKQLCITNNLLQQGLLIWWFHLRLSQFFLAHSSSSNNVTCLKSGIKRFSYYSL